MWGVSMKLILRGGTRIVILTKHRAYKIARIRPLRLFCRLLVLPFQAKRKHIGFAARYGPFPVSLWNYVIIGLIANRNEFEYWQETRDPRVAPVIGKVLGGIVIWQTVGESVTLSELRRNDPFASFPVDARKEFHDDMVHQYAKVNGQVVLIDFGENHTRRTLKKTFCQQ
jgi:hypothetical protein